MAYTFGALASDDITFTFGLTLGATNRAQLIAGWWYPTTLTATRGLWSAGNVMGAEIAATTSELVLRTDNTTDGQWTTTGANLVVDQWRFLAFYLTATNTPAAQWRVWSGDLQTPPAACTITVNTAPVGNFVGNTSFYVGNKGTSTTQAFQGAVGNVAGAALGNAAPPLGIFNSTNFGQLNAEQELWIYQNYVLPYWLGEAWPRAMQDTSYGGGGNVAAFFMDMDCTPSPRVWQFSSGTAATFLAPAVSGATKSLLRSPIGNGSLKTSKQIVVRR
jgi:hypothetical protein